MNRFLILFLCLGQLFCCGQVSNSNSTTNHSPMPTEPSTLAEKLAQDVYGNFFNYAIQEQIIQTVWQEAGGVAPLKAVVANKEATTKARLIAHEILLKKEFTYMAGDPDLIAKVAKVYADALANNITEMANSWGLLYEHDDAGPVGISFIMLEKYAIPELVKLLNNTTPLLYIGSKESTIGNAYQFQVKDAAAYYICRIKNITPVYHETRADRDAEIERLKLLLKLN